MQPNALFFSLAQEDTETLDEVALLPTARAFHCALRFFLNRRFLSAFLLLKV